MTPVTAPSVYEHRGTRAVQRMLEFAPATGSLALWMRHVDLPEPTSVLIENDGATIRYGPAFEGVSLVQQTGLVAHQVLHVALRHAPRYLALCRERGNVDLVLFNRCADAIVNSSLAHLGWLELRETLRLETVLRDVLGLNVVDGAALLEWDVEKLYRAIDDRRAAGGRKSGSKQAKQGEGSSRASGSSDRPSDSPDRPNASSQQASASADKTSATTASSAPDAAQADDESKSVDGPKSARMRLLGSGSLPDLVPDAHADRPEMEIERARDWRERIVRGHADDGSHSMLRTLLADLPRVRTPWEQLLRARLARGLSLQPSLSWSRPARSWIANQGRGPNGQRMPWEPGRVAGRRTCRLAIMVDVSGSIDHDLLQRFAREIDAITRRTEANGVLVIGDDSVRHVASFEPGKSTIATIDCNGGGGTDFSPLLEEADRWNPDLGVFLTDLDGPAHYRPRFPVLWAVVGDSLPRELPFGTSVLLD